MKLPAVTYLPPRPEKYQRAGAKWRDPDTGKYRTQALPPGADPEVWIATKRHELYLRQIELARGAPRAVGTGIGDILDKYFDEAPIRTTTAEVYRDSVRVFRAWGGVRTGDQLSLALLRDFRAWVIRATPNPHTTNRHLRTVALILEFSRQAGRCAHLTRDAIRDGLQRVRAPVERKPFLSPDQCRAAILGTREHVRPFVIAALLTGMRRAELLAAQEGWRRDGGIDIPAAYTKTGHGRYVDLSITNGRVALAHDLTPDQVREAGRKAGWTPHLLRRTCGTYLACAPGIWGAASIYLTARQLGHSVAVAEKHYLGRVRIPASARTLEAAMGIADLVPGAGDGRGVAQVERV